jgi:hypothetical protein
MFSAKDGAPTASPKESLLAPEDAKAVRHRLRREKKRQHMFAGLTAQIRMAMHITASNKDGGLRKVFEAFDQDGNHMVDKDEFLDGCQRIGVKITKDEVELMWPYFDLDNSGEVGIEEFLALAEMTPNDGPSDHMSLHRPHADKFIPNSSEISKYVQLQGTSRSSSPTHIHIKRTATDRQMLQSKTKAQRRRSVTDSNDRRPSAVTDEKVLAIISQQRWSLTQMRQKVSRLPLPAASAINEQAWLADTWKPVPAFSKAQLECKKAAAKTKRNWREVVFQQVRCDNELRPVREYPSPWAKQKLSSPTISKVQATAAWERYRGELNKLQQELRAREVAAQKNRDDKIAALEKLRREAEEEAEHRREAGLQDGEALDLEPGWY